MYRGFPAALLPLLRCSRDGEELVLDSSELTEPFLHDATLRCVRCQSTYPISGGIVSLLIDGTLDRESVHEMRERDTQFTTPAESQDPFVAATDPFVAQWRNATEVEPTLAACAPYTGKVIAEFGCGSGFFTRLLAKHAAAMLAIDLSHECLVQLGSTLEGNEPIGLVRADIGWLHLAPKSFDVVLTTAHSNLPTRHHRLASNRTASEALTDGGRYVFSMHFHAARDFLRAIPAAGHYDGTGIYRYHMRPAEARREIAPYFKRVGFAPILMSLPHVRNLAVIRFAQRIPGLNNLAPLFLGVAVRPRREAMVNHVSRLSLWVTRLLGRTPAIATQTATRTN